MTGESKAKTTALQDDASGRPVTRLWRGFNSFEWRVYCGLCPGWRYRAESKADAETIRGVHEKFHQAYKRRNVVNSQ